MSVACSCVGTYFVLGGMKFMLQLLADSVYYGINCCLVCLPLLEYLFHCLLIIVGHVKKWLLLRFVFLVPPTSSLLLWSTVSAGAVTVLVVGVL